MANPKKGAESNWYKHGFAMGENRKINRTWRDMLRRCNNPNYRTYRWYGGKGIKVCERWSDPEDGFPNFLKDMGHKPTPRHSLDRIDNTKGYSPENCRWATYDEQARNNSRTRMVIIGSRTMCLKDWCVEYGIRYDTVWTRQKRGWDVIEAITTPLKIQRH